MDEPSPLELIRRQLALAVGENAVFDGWTQAAVDAAAAAGIPTIAYDRLLTDNENVDFYVTFDNYKVGVNQANALMFGLGLLDESFEPRPEVDPAADVDGWPRTGEVPASRRARVWISPERARWAREERTVVEELADGSVIVELSFAGVDWLVREVLKEAGDAAVLEPADARASVREAAGRLAAA